MVPEKYNINFIFQFQKDNTPADLENTDSQDMADNTDENTDDKTGDKTLDKSDDISIYSSDSTLTKKKNPGKAKKSHNTAQEMSGITAAIDELKQLNSTIESSSSSRQEDEYDVVGKHVAIQLRQLPLLDFLDAKDEIQQVLSRYRKAIYSRNASALSSYSASSPQSNIASPSSGPSVPFSGTTCQPTETVSVHQPLQSVDHQPSHSSYKAASLETVSAQQPVQPGQIFDLNDILVKAMINANVNNML